MKKKKKKKKIDVPRSGECLTFWRQTCLRFWGHSPFLPIGRQYEKSHILGIVFYCPAY